ncbi:MAG: hypothetical protein HFJ49_02965 [Clostridia bacterium]|nr:hypothetical protein [Clostridia bacterium]
MKDKIKIICVIIYLFIICSIYSTTYAITEGTVYLQSDKSTFKKGEEIEITVFLENIKTVSFSTYLYFDNSKVEYISDLENTNIVDNNHIVFVWYDISGGSNPKQGELAKFKFRAKEDGMATFNIEGEFYNEAREVLQTKFKDIQIQIGENVVEQYEIKENTQNEQNIDVRKDNAMLEVLRLDKEGIIPNFDKNIYDYYLTVNNDVDYIDILAISENRNSNIEIIGNNNLKEGLNVITIKVISEDKTQSREYKIQVTKTNNIELANTNLENLAIEGILLNPPFDTNITHYKIYVPNNITNLNILAIPQNENANVEISGKDNLKEGINIINVIVTAQNGFSERKYEINCYKRNEKEEKDFQKEEKENMEQLEKIYETQQVSNTNEIEEQYIFKVIIAAILSICVITVFAIYWGKYLKK